MGNGGFGCRWLKLQNVSAWWKKTGQTPVLMLSYPWWNTMNLYQATINYQSALWLMLKFCGRTFVEHLYMRTPSRSGATFTSEKAPVNYFFNTITFTNIYLTLGKQLFLIQFSLMNSRNNKIWREKPQVKRCHSKEWRSHSETAMFTCLTVSWESKQASTEYRIITSLRKIVLTAIIFPIMSRCYILL